MSYCTLEEYKTARQQGRCLSLLELDDKAIKDLDILGRLKSYNTYEQCFELVFTNLQRKKFISTFNIVGQPDICYDSAPLKTYNDINRCQDNLWLYMTYNKYGPLKFMLEPYLLKDLYRIVIEYCVDLFSTKPVVNRCLFITCNKPALDCSQSCNSHGCSVCKCQLVVCKDGLCSLHLERKARGQCSVYECCAKVLNTKRECREHFKGCLEPDCNGQSRCDLHGCICCNRANRKVSNSEYCLKSKCKVNNCVNAYWLCEHTCKVTSCSEPRINDKYCRQHNVNGKCCVITCPNMTKGNKHCQSCKCKYGTCDKKREQYSQGCEDHTCQATDCSMIASKTSVYCRDHVIMQKYNISSD